MWVCLWHKPVWLIVMYTAYSNDSLCGIMRITYNAFWVFIVWFRWNLALPLIKMQEKGQLLITFILCVRLKMFIHNKHRYPIWKLFLVICSNLHIVTYFGSALYAMWTLSLYKWCSLSHWLCWQIYFEIQRWIEAYILSTA